MPRTAAEYMTLPYTLTVKWDPRDEIFVAGVLEIPGCSAHGATENEALSNLRDNMLSWIEDCLDSGDSVPIPNEQVELPSGKWVQRVPRTLHLRLIRMAKEDGVSLNQFVTSALAEAVGRRETNVFHASTVASGVSRQNWHWNPTYRSSPVYVVADPEPAFGQPSFACDVDAYYDQTSSAAFNVMVQRCLQESPIGLMRSSRSGKERSFHAEIKTPALK